MLETLSRVSSLVSPGHDERSEIADDADGQAGVAPLLEGQVSAIFARLCGAVKARGKLIAGAYHAALAIEHGCELASLRRRHPLCA